MQAFTHRNYLIVEDFQGVYLCIVMKKFNGKNLRREVQRQLKELRGRVAEQALLATKTMTKTEDQSQTTPPLSLPLSEGECGGGNHSTNSTEPIIDLKHPSLPELEQFIRRD